MPGPDTLRLQASIVDYARPDFTTLPESLTIAQALERIRREGVGERIIYFYVTDASGKLVGVLPTRRLLTAPADQPLSAVMVRRVAAIPQTAIPAHARPTLDAYLAAETRLAEALRDRDRTGCYVHARHGVVGNARVALFQEMGDWKPFPLLWERTW